MFLSEDLTSIGKKQLESCLVGKVFSSKAVNRETFRVQMPRILQAKKHEKIDVIGENLFQLDFLSEADRRHCLMDGPWSFFIDLVVFQIPTGFQKSIDMVFDEMPIWFQCHNVPLAFMNVPILRNIGSKHVRVLEVDSGEDGKCTGRYAFISIFKDHRTTATRNLG